MNWVLILVFKHYDQCEMSARHHQGKNMSTPEYKMEFVELSKQSELGELISNPFSVTGGHLHRVYSLETTTGKYVVKLLNPNIMIRQNAVFNYINSEKIAQLAAENVPALPAEKRNGNSLQNINGQFYLVFKWVDAISLGISEIDISHCRIMGGILAGIHQTDFSKLKVVQEEGGNGKTTEWSTYLQRGRAMGVEWADLLHEALQDIIEWDLQAQVAREAMSSGMIISHRDLEPKNVLWQNDTPLLIDWESAGYIHSAQDLLETAIYWSKNATGKIIQLKFSSFLNGYKEKCQDDLQADWNMVIASGFSGKLEWLEYNLKRSLWIECTDEEEQKLGTAQVIQTIYELRKYAMQIPDLSHWLDSYLE